MRKEDATVQRYKDQQFSAVKEIIPVYTENHIKTINTKYIFLIVKPDGVYVCLCVCVYIYIHTHH
jgi:hypothetical protein